MKKRCKQCLSSVQTLIAKPMTKHYVCPKHGRISNPALVEDVQLDITQAGNNNFSDSNEEEE